MFDALRRRLTLLCTAATGVILLAMTCACLLLSQSLLTRGAEAAFRRDVNGILFYFQSQSALERSVVDVTWLAQTEGDGRLLLHAEVSGDPLRYPGTGDPALRVALVSQARALAARSGLDLDRPPERRVASNDVSFRLTGPDGQTYRAAAATVSAARGWVGLVILQSTAPQEAELGLQRLLFTLFGLVALCLLALFAWFFTRRAVRPIEENRKKQVEFVSAASHELRAPLAVIHASLTSLPGAEAGEQARLAALADGECMRMSRLVGDLLALAGADGGRWSIQASDTELETLVLDVCEAFETAAGDRGLRLTPRLPQDPLPRCRCDRERVRQVLTILVDNAISYTPAGGQITAAVDANRHGFRLTVSDTGPGVPDREKDRIFARFYRADAARAGREHYGLGLSIAREIATLHRGRLSVDDRPGGGAVFTLYLPF